MFLLFFAFVPALFLLEGQCSDPDGACKASMFSDDDDVIKAALLSCQAQRALQRNWYPDPIGGLFSYQTWNGMDGFWQNGIAIESMANAMKYGNHSRYLSVVKSSHRELESLLLAYGPNPSFDDMAWYGLAYARVFELFRIPEFLRVSKEIFEWCWTHGWDKTGSCHGMWFDTSYTAKQTIENVQMYQLGMKLAHLDRANPDSNPDESESYSSRATEILKFINETGIVDQDSFKVFDGVSTTSCKVEDKKTIYTYTAGTLVGGFVEEYKLTGKKSLLTMAHNLANSVLKFLTKDGVLTEICDPNDGCSLDARSFKGIFVRNLRYLMDVDSKNLDQYLTFLQRNVKALMANASCTPQQTSNATDCHIVYLDGPPVYNKTGPVFGAAWNFPLKDARPMAQVSALDLLTASISPRVRCTDRTDCSYDPPNPPPTKLTCKDDPCPHGVDCCQYQETSYTCCAPGQKCREGFCD